MPPSPAHQLPAGSLSGWRKTKHNKKQTPISWCKLVRHECNRSHYHQSRLLVRVDLNDTPQPVVEGQVKLELRASIWVAQDHPPQPDWPVALIDVKLQSWTVFGAQPRCNLHHSTEDQPQYRWCHRVPIQVVPMSQEQERFRKYFLNTYLSHPIGYPLLHTPSHLGH